MSIQMLLLAAHPLKPPGLIIDSAATTPYGYLPPHLPYESTLWFRGARTPGTAVAPGLSGCLGVARGRGNAPPLMIAPLGSLRSMTLRQCIRSLNVTSPSPLMSRKWRWLRAYLHKVARQAARQSYNSLRTTISTELEQSTGHWRDATRTT
jgi:hypothetical protein